MRAVSRLTTSAIAVLFVLPLLATAARAADAPAATKPAGPIKAELVLNKDSYALDPAQSGAAFREKLMDKKRQGPLPPTAKVDMILRLTNVTDQPFSMQIGGDESRITLQLDGPGAVTVDNIVPMTMEFRMGKPVTIAPGKTYEIPITSLSFGTRGISQCAFWTEPGDYTLSATLTAAQGEAQVSFTSDAAKIKVTKN